MVGKQFWGCGWSEKCGGLRTRNEQVLSCFMLLICSNTADLIDGIRMHDAATQSSPTSDDCERSEDTETTAEPMENGGSPVSGNYGTNIFDDNIPKYTDVQVDEVRRYGFDIQFMIKETYGLGVHFRMIIS